jgi:PAS domain S-box-containing protein
VLWRDGELRTAAIATRRHKTLSVRLRDEVITESLLPESVLYRVQRSRECVVIDDAATRAGFSGDPYIRQRKAAAILSLPLLNQSKLAGVLFLESYLISGIFTPARIAVLKLVASLAASALDTSRLYGDLMEREAKIRRLVDANIVGIFIVDIGGPILEANDAYLHMLGYEQRDLVSGRLRWTELTPPEWRTADAERVKRVKKIGRLQPFEKEFFRRDGTRVPVMMGVARFRNPRNQAVVFALDMSRQKQAETIALESRMIEHTHNAWKMHDEILQNFQGMMFQFQAARNLMPRHPDEALRSLSEAIHDGEQTLSESRDAILDLHPKPKPKLN